MTTPPEVVFDRAIRDRFPEHRRVSYSGKFVIDPEQHPLLHDVQNLINEMYGSHADRFVVDGNTSPRLHFDFIEGSAVNALAFNDGGYSFVGLTVALVHEFEKLASALVSSESVRELLCQSKLDSDQIQQLWTALVITMLQFVAFHELGHHLHGHCPTTNSLSVTALEEYDPTAAEPRGLNLEFQADELDADEFAIRTLAENLLAGDARPEILVMLGCPPDEGSDDHLLAAMTLAAGTFFFHRQNTAEDLSKLEAADHPPAPARMYRAMTVLHEWLLANRPGSADWVVGDQYLRVMQIGISSINNDAGGAAWNLQTSFLDSDAGQGYLKLLESSSHQRRESLKTKKWKLRKC